MVANINSALVANPTGGAEEMVHIYADPSNSPRDSPSAARVRRPAASRGGAVPPPRASAAGCRRRPRGWPASAVASARRRACPGSRSWPTSRAWGCSRRRSKLGVDLGGGGMIGGDVTYETSDVGAALDQLAREILRHLGQHKLTVVWLFDESESMKDDQKAIREKFDRVASELKVNADAVAKKKAAEIAPDPCDRRLRQRPPLRAREADAQCRPDRPGHRAPQDRRHGHREHDARDHRGDQPLFGPDQEGPPAR